MSTKTGNEPQLSGAQKRKEQMEFEADLDRLMKMGRNNPPNMVIKGKTPLLDALVNPLVKRLSDLMDEQEKPSDDAPMIGGKKKQ